jgi:hypothetical protein
MVGACELPCKVRFVFEVRRLVDWKNWVVLGEVGLWRGAERWHWWNHWSSERYLHGGSLVAGRLAVECWSAS